MRTTTYAVTGITPGLCVAAVTRRISTLTGVRGVGVDLVAGGTTVIRVTSDVAVRAEDVRAAVRDAWSELSQASVGEPVIRTLSEVVS